MMIAQQLYEGVELPGEGAVGLITYMRTDSTRVSEQAIGEVRQFVAGAYGPDYVPEKPNFFRTKSDAQDAHEAIRPTSMQYHPDEVRAHLTHDQYYLYKLIWNRFVASQMTPATFDDTTVDITAGDYLFRVKGSVPKFAGWLAVYQAPVAGAAAAAGGTSEEIVAPGPDARTAEDDEESSALPALARGDVLTLRELKPEQKFTQPPPRYTEATLVKALEENGIGRPSTYASIIGVIQAREYVNKVEGKFKPTYLGMMLVEKLLSPAFDDILDVNYTRELEEDLDKIESGASDYEKTLTSFYKKFQKDLKRAAKDMPNMKEGYEPDPPVACDKCGKPMVIKAGKFGLFLACSGYPACTGYPECKTTRKIIATKQGLAAAKPDQILDERCPKCGSNLVVKQGRFGEFTACTSYPTCRYVKQKTTGVLCPKDGGDVVERKSRRGKVFYGCANYPDCDFTLWNRPVAEKCPDCGAPFLVEKVTKRHGRQLVCNNEECSYTRQVEELQPA
jgi:DNA topoisomerase-1